MGVFWILGLGSRGAELRAASTTAAPKTTLGGSEDWSLRVRVSGWDLGVRLNKIIQLRFKSVSCSSLGGKHVAEALGASRIGRAIKEGSVSIY